MVRSPPGLSPNRGGGTATHRGSMIGLAEGWVDAGGTSVLEDCLVGLVYMLGHLWCSTLQGQLQEKRRAGKELIPGALQFRW